MGVGKPQRPRDLTAVPRVPHGRDIPPTQRSANRAATPFGLLPPNKVVPAAVFGGWAAALIALAIFTANPVTLNRAQIIDAETIVEAVCLNEGGRDGGKSWHVKRSWPPESTPAQIQIDGLDHLPLRSGRVYLVPVNSRAEGRYQLASSTAVAAAFIYPSSPQTVADLEAILAEAADR